MRVLQISHYYPPQIGGLGNFVRSLAEKLADHGHEVAVLTTTAGGGAAGDVVEAHGVRVVRQHCWNGLEAVSIPWPVVLPTHMGAVRELLQWADVVHAHGILFLNSAVGCAYSRLTSTPLVVTEHVGVVPYKSPWVLSMEVGALWSLGRAVSRLADAMVVVNRPVYDQMARLRAFRGDLEIIPYGVDMDVFHPAASAEERRALREKLGWDDKPRVVCLARMSEKKGLDVLAAAADPAYEIVLVGNGTPPPLRPGVSFMGPIPFEQVPDLLRASDIFSLMSVGEGFPLAIQEAMATQLPVVITDDPRYWEYLSRTETGMVPPKAERVREQLLRYVRDPALAARAGRYGQDTARRLFSWESVLGAHERLYDRVTRRTAGRHKFGVAPYDLATLDKLPELAHLMAPASADGPALDVGTGNGFTQSEVLRGSPRVVVDSYAPNLELCRKSVAAAGAPPVLAVRASVDALPFKDGAFTTVLCSEVLEHCENDSDVAAELSRVMKDKGVLVLSVPGMRFGFDSFLHLAGLRTVHDRAGPERHHRPGYPLHDLKPLLEAHGLHVEEVREYCGPLTKLVLDGVSLGNLAYQRMAGNGAAFTWSDIATSERSAAFRAYRTVFPLLRAVVALDRNLPMPRGFQLALRARKGPVGANLDNPTWVRTQAAYYDPDGPPLATAGTTSR